MQVKHAALAGSSIGALAACSICLIMNVSFSDAVFRVSILAVAGAWMGMLLVWLNDLLKPSSHEQMSRVHRRNRL